jgi:putative methionine-R-sulfoxide reductase with GAF domain
VNGVNIFDPKEIRDNETVPPIAITDFQIFNKAVPIGDNSILNQSINFTNEITLRYEQAVLSFQFSSLNFTFPEKNQFTYMLENFDADWNAIGSKRTATYTNLDPGEYVFRVKGSNNDNVWNEAGVSLKIRVLPPYWRTWWFYTLMALVAALLIYGFVKFREREIKKDKAQLERTLNDSLNRANAELARQKQAVLEEQERNKERNWTDQSLSLFGEILSKSKDDVKELCTHVLTALVKHLQVAGGAFYVLDEAQELNLLATSGFSAAKTTIGSGEGLVGACFESREVKNIDNVPLGYHKISSGLGEARPSCVLLVPLKSEEICLGVLEVASFNALPPYQQKFVEQLAVRMTTTLNTTIMAQRTAILLAESKTQAEELKVREEELKQNLEELQAIHEDRDRMDMEMKKEIEELKSKLRSQKK